MAHARTGDGDSVPGKVIVSDVDLARIVDRIAHQVLEKTDGARDTLLLGVPTRGVPLSLRLAERIRAFEGVAVPTGTLDVTLYRDDLRLRGARAIGPTDLPPGGLDGLRVILVDDVLYSGRTIRAALDALADLGRPRLVQLAVLVDRGHRELPIRADYVGKNIPTAIDELVEVCLTETDGIDEVRIRPADTAGATPAHHNRPGGDGAWTEESSDTGSARAERAPRKRAARPGDAHVDRPGGDGAWTEESSDEGASDEGRHRPEAARPARAERAQQSRAARPARAERAPRNREGR